MRRSGKAVWLGTGLEGSGSLTTPSGVLAEQPYSTKMRFADAEGRSGINPEELIAAAHAGCFAMALSFQLTGAGFAPSALHVESVITMAQQGFDWSMAGIVLTRQRPVTAKGMIFLTIEDETGAANIVIRPDVWGRADHAARRAAVLVVHGRIQRRGPVVHVVATHLEAAARRDDDAEPPSVASPALSALPRMSRDFC